MCTLVWHFMTASHRLELFVNHTRQHKVRKRIYFNIKAQRLTEVTHISPSRIGMNRSQCIWSLRIIFTETLVQIPYNRDLTQNHLW